MGYARQVGGSGGSSGPKSKDLTATTGQVLNGSTYVGSDTNDEAGSGSMSNIAAIDSMKSVVLSGSNLYIRMSNGAHITNASSGYPEVSGAATTFINALGIASITNFKVAQYSSQKLQLTWAKPSSGLWSGVRIVGKQSGYPSSESDGTVFCDSNSNSYISGSIATGTWYFRAYNYITWTGGRAYGSSVTASINNQTISGSKNFTSGGSWTVPSGVYQIQYFLVGGGGGTYCAGKTASSNGGGGGYTKTGYASVSPGNIITVTVGSGGSGNSSGGSSSLSGAVNVSASGGSPGLEYSTRTYSGYGGSGGGAQGGTQNGGAGGSYGGNGTTTSYASAISSGPGSGQGSTTACPWDSIVYAGGGGGGSAKTKNGSGGSGGSGGGGAGGYKTTGTAGTSNTGGGAGGCANAASTTGGRSASGGSGIVRIRW